MPAAPANESPCEPAEVLSPAGGRFSPPTPNPVGVTGPAGDIFKIMAVGGELLIPATGLAAIASLAFRYRRAGTAERAQLKWLLYAGAVIVVALVATIPIERIMGPNDTANNLENAMSSGAVALVAVAIGIALLRYRLMTSTGSSPGPWPTRS